MDRVVSKSCAEKNESGFEFQGAPSPLPLSDTSKGISRGRVYSMGVGTKSGAARIFCGFHAVLNQGMLLS